MAEHLSTVHPARRRVRQAGLFGRLAAVVAILAAAAAAGAQELETQLPEIRTLLREKRYVPALQSLRLVALQIQELRLEALSPALPAAPAGWIGMSSGSINGEWMIPMGANSIFIFLMATIFFVPFKKQLLVGNMVGKQFLMQNNRNFVT